MRQQTIPKLGGKQQQKNPNLQSNVTKSFLSITHTKRTITFRANLSPLKLPYAVYKPINASTSWALLRHNASNATRSRACRYSPPVHFLYTFSLYNLKNKQTKSTNFQLKTQIGHQIEDHLSSILKGF